MGTELDKTMDKKERLNGLAWLDQYLEESLMVALLVAMTLAMGLQVLSRYLLNLSLPWSEEVTRYLFVWSAFISVSYCTKKCVSIKVEQAVSMLSKRGQAGVKLLNHSIELIFFFYMIPFAFLYLKSAIDSGQVSPACGIPMYVVQAAPLFSFILVAIRIIQRWVIELKTLRRV